MKNDKTFLRIQAIIVDKLNVHESEVTLEARPEYDLGSDSLDTVEIVMEIEQEFNIKIYDQFLPALNSVKNLVIYTNNYLDTNNEENYEHFKVEH